MSAMASQIAGVSIACWTVFQVQIEENIKVPRLGICVWNPRVTGGFPSQRASSIENVSIWWSHHGDPVPILQLSQMSSFKKRCMMLRFM